MLPVELTVVVPTYNERDRLGALLERIFGMAAALPIAIEVIVVDDNSRDGTGALADDWARRCAVRVIHRLGKLGLGSAVVEGVASATSDLVVVMDADLSHPPEVLPSLYRAAIDRELDMVVASRYVPGGGTTRWPLARRLLSRAGCALARPLTPIRDPTSGFFLIRRERALSVGMSGGGFKIGLELLVRAPLRRVGELPYCFINREAGQSKMTVAEGLRYLRQLVRLHASVAFRALSRPAYLAIERRDEGRSRAALGGVGA